MELVSLAVFAGALILAAGLPGPSIAALVSRVLAEGWRDVAPFVTAMWAGELIWLTCALAGLSQLAQSFQLGFEVLRWLGVAYLGWMAWQMWRRPAVTEAAPMPRARSGASMFAAGLALTLGNPKIMVFYLALLPSLIDMDSVGLGAWAVLALVMLASLALVDFAWIALAQRARGLLRTPRAVRLSNRLGATAIGGAAAMIAVRG